MPTITIELTPAQVQRLADAWEEQFGKRPDVQDVKAHLVRELKAIVFHGEKTRAERLAAAPVPFDPTVTITQPGGPA